MASQPLAPAYSRWFFVPRSAGALPSLQVPGPTQALRRVGVAETELRPSRNMTPASSQPGLLPLPAQNDHLPTTSHTEAEIQLIPKLRLHFIQPLRGQHLG